jgi:hypothetical protein
MEIMALDKGKPGKLHRNGGKPGVLRLSLR